MMRINLQKNPPPSANRSRKEGIAMVEALLAIVLFALFITGSAKMLLSHRQMTDMARAHYTAINIAKNRLELIRSFDHDQRLDFEESNVLINNHGLPSQTGHYRRSTTFTEVSSNITEVAISVDIRDRKTLKFDGRTETLNSFFALYLGRP